MKHVSLYLIIAALTFAFPGKVIAHGENTADTSALPVMSVRIEDVRVKQLEQYLGSHSSPLEQYAGHFVAEADRLGMDWKLVAAIAGVESTFGKHVPYNSYNGWGWGIYTGANDGVHFADWKDGITTVSEGLRYRYMDRGAVTVEQIGRIYAASPAWSYKVRFFLDKIESYSPTGVSHLAITI